MARNQYCLIIGPLSLPLSHCHCHICTALGKFTHCFAYIVTCLSWRTVHPSFWAGSFWKDRTSRIPVHMKWTGQKLARHRQIHTCIFSLTELKIGPVRSSEMTNNLGRTNSVSLTSPSGRVSQLDNY